MTSDKQARVYEAAMESVGTYLELEDMEPLSAIKQAGSDHGIAFGDEMDAFVTFALKRLGLS